MICRRQNKQDEEMQFCMYKFITLYTINTYKYYKKEEIKRKNKQKKANPNLN